MNFDSEFKILFLCTLADCSLSLSLPINQTDAVWCLITLDAIKLYCKLSGWKMKYSQTDQKLKWKFSINNTS